MPNTIVMVRFTARLILSLCLLSLAFEPAYAARKPEEVDALLQEMSSRARRNANNYWDELFDAEGKLREQYKDLFPVFAQMSPTQVRNFLKQSRADFQGDNALFPLPEIITQRDYNVMKTGVEQRGMAILKFLQDHYSGAKAYLKAGVIPEQVIRRIIGRNNELGYEGLVNPDAIRFSYRLDSIRDAKNNRLAIEDNPGFVGGPGDLLIAPEILKNRIPAYRGRILSPDPWAYYQGLLDHYKSVASPGKGAIVLYSVPPYPDNEDARLSKTWSELGVEVVTPFTKKQLKVDKAGAYLEWTSDHGRTLRKRVGFLILNSEHQWADPSHPVTRSLELANEVKAVLEDKQLGKRTRRALEAAVASGDELEVMRVLRRSKYHFSLPDFLRHAPKGLTSHLLSGRVPTNYTPGVDFIGDKEFYLYVEDLIRFYLHQEPIIRNIPTERFATIGKDGTAVVNHDLVKRVFTDIKPWVVKPVDGRGGDGIAVGPRVKAKEIRKVKAAVLAAPERHIAQKFTHLSVLANYIVDQNVLAHIDPKGVVVSPVIWGRGLPLEGNGKVNLSGDGVEFAVFVTPDAGTGNEMPPPYSKVGPASANPSPTDCILKTIEKVTESH